MLGGVLGGEPRRAPRARRRGGELCISSCGSGGGAVAPARRQTLADPPRGICAYPHAAVRVGGLVALDRNLSFELGVGSGLGLGSGSGLRFVFVFVFGLGFALEHLGLPKG